MKKSTLLLFIAGSLIACTNNTTTAEKKGDDKDVKVAGMSTGEKIDLPYKVESNGDWTVGSRQNLKTALDFLKSWEQNDMVTAMRFIGDSIELKFDGFEKKLPKAEAEKTLAAQRNVYRDVKIDMSDYESVSASNGKEQWVSLWYMQKYQDMGMKWDSLSIMDDIRVQNGKITVLDEKTRHYAKH